MPAGVSVIRRPQCLPPSDDSANQSRAECRALPRIKMRLIMDHPKSHLKFSPAFVIEENDHFLGIHDPPHLKIDGLGQWGDA